MKRRSFLKTTTAATATAALAPSILNGMAVKASSPLGMLGKQAQENENIVIIIQLFGGNDGLNTIVPANDDEYYKLRPSIAIPKAQAKQYASSDLFFHPSLVDGVYIGNKDTKGFQSMIDNGRLAVIQGIGYENPNLSHFRSTDIWLSGINSTDPRSNLTSGWIGRYFAKKLTNYPIEVPEHPIAIQIGGALSLLLQSPKGDMGIALTDPQKFFEQGQGLSPDEAYLPGDTSYVKEFNYIRTIAAQCDTYSKVVKTAYDKGKNVTRFSSGGLAAQLGLVSRLISGGLKTKVYMVSMGGFDTHINQQIVTNGNLTGGNHMGLLNSLATAVTQFMDDALNQGFAGRVVGLTVSEFGRRPGENGSQGSDHGAASVQFVFGTPVKGGQYGRPPDLKTLTANGDQMYQYDYRRPYVDILKTWFGATDEDVIDILGEQIFPLNLLTVAGVENEWFATVEKAPAIFPNPVVDDVSVVFELPKPMMVKLDLFDSRGVFVRDIATSFFSIGRNTFPFGSAVKGLSNGSYILSVSAGGRRVGVPLVVAR